jgi:hypothetical protein
MWTVTSLAFNWDTVGGEQANTWDLRFLRSWKLVKIPRHTAGLDWDGNTEGWESEILLELISYFENVET